MDEVGSHRQLPRTSGVLSVMRASSPRIKVRRPLRTPQRQPDLAERRGDLLQRQPVAVVVAHGEVVAAGGGYGNGLGSVLARGHLGLYKGATVGQRGQP